MTALDFFLWVAYPYAVGGVFVAGHFLRYRYDQFGWTARSSQTYENRLLRWASPMFHYGILMVAGGHFVGLFVPKSWLAFFGVTEEIYHLGATWLGTFAALLTVGGLGILLYRRRFIDRVRMATTRMDIVMLVLLTGAIGFGTVATVMYQVIGGGYDYRESISPWIRSLVFFQPDPSLMAGVPLFFQLHIVTAMTLFLLWPFTRLVHVFSAPIGYILRPYIVYRSRDVHRGTGARRPRRGWAGSQVPTRRRERAQR